MQEDGYIYEEAKLLSLLAGGSEYAFQVLYDHYRARIYQIAIRYLKSPPLAQEVVQDVFLKLWFKRTDIKEEKGIEAWLYTVAKNNIINRLKKIAREWKALDGLQLVSVTVTNNTADKMQEACNNELLRQAIRGLSGQQQKVFQLARFEQLSYIQIGEQMGLSPLTVKTHMSRAIAHIRCFFEEHGEIFFSCLVLLSFR